MKIKTLHNALVFKINALLDIEKELIKALPAMEERASDEELKSAFKDHLVETKNQKDRLEGILEVMGEKPSKVKVEGIRGIIADAQWMMKQEMSSELQDATLIGAALYVEHYEIAGYEGAIAWAEVLALPEIAASLQETLDEEQTAMKKLETIRSQSVDVAAGAFDEIEEAE